jgi:hypothetical protein
MKIDGTSPIHRLVGPRQVGDPGTEAASSSARTSDSVQLSSAAKWLQGIEAAAGSMEGVRGDVVQQAQSDIASGGLGDAQDIEQTLDALMAELT